MALRDVMDHAVVVERAVAAPVVVGRSNRAARWAVLCALSMGLALYSWLARPETLWGPRRPPASARSEDNMRLAMFLMARRAEAYRKTRGSLPASVDALGGTASALTLRLLGDSVFEIRGMDHGKLLVYRSTDEPREFLGGAALLAAPARR